AMRYIHAGNLMVFAKPLTDGEWAFLFLNRGDNELNYTHDWAFNEVKDDQKGYAVNFERETFTWQNLWENGTGTTDKPLVLSIPAHDVVVLRLTPKTN